jgi:hypothetical protein
MLRTMGSRNVERDKPSVAERVPLATYVRDHGDWAINVCCQGCAHVATINPVRMLTRLGQKARIGDMAARLKCARCDCRIFRLKPVFVGKRRD